MARSYKRDANGRFAGGGGGSGGGGKRPAAKPVSRGTNRLTRDNAGKITGTGNGATARGGRLKTASGKQRATQTAKATGGGRAGTIKGRVTRNPQAGAKLATAGKVKVRKVNIFDQPQRAYDRTKGIELKRHLNESARDSAYRSQLDKNQTKHISYEKRFASENMRRAKSARTAAAAKAFLDTYGPASTFGRRPIQSTASSPNFGSKRRGRRRK